MIASLLLHGVSCPHPEQRQKPRLQFRFLKGADTLQSQQSDDQTERYCSRMHVCGPIGVTSALIFIFAVTARSCRLCNYVSGNGIIQLVGNRCAYVSVRHVRHMGIDT